VNLAGWYLDDLAGGGKSARMISGSISAKSYKQFFLDDYFFNNSGDDVRVLDGSQNEKDKKSFTSSAKGKAWAKDNSGNWCQIDPTPNSANPNCPLSIPTSTPTVSATATPSLTPTVSLIPSFTPTTKEETLLITQPQSSPLVLGEETMTTTKNPGKVGGFSKYQLIAGASIFLGLALLGFSFFFLYKETRR